MLKDVGGGQHTEPVSEAASAPGCVGFAASSPCSTNKLSVVAWMGHKTCNRAAPEATNKAGADHKCRWAHQNWMSLYPPQCTSKRDMFSSALMLGVEKAAAGTTSWKGFFRMPPAASQLSRISEQQHQETTSRRSVLQSASVLSDADTKMHG